MVSDVYFPRVNGVSTSIQTFRRDLIALGCETELIAPAYPACSAYSAYPACSACSACSVCSAGAACSVCWAPRVDEPGVHRVRSRYLPFDPEDRIMRRRDFERVVRGLPEAFDIVHVQTPFLAHYWGAKLARRMGAKLVVSYHTYFEHYFHHYLPLVPAAWLKFLARSISRSQLNASDLVIAPSEPMADALADYGVDARIEVLPTGLDLELFRGGDGRRFRIGHGIDGERPLMLTVGRVAFEKNLQFLVDVLATVRSSVPDVLLVIAGEGPALEPLKRQVARRGLGPNVLFVGYLDRATGLLDCYRSAEVFVFASRTETQGLVLLEAMALGTPVVSTAVMGTKAVLADAPAVVVAEDRAEFAAAVSRLLGQPEERARLGRASVRHVAECWSGAKLAGHLLGLYSGLFENPIEDS